jgi:hypothetical protein
MTDEIRTITNQFGTVHLDDRGRYHREDGGPAVDTADSLEWYRHGDLHRLRGPAVMAKRTDHIEWWLEGESYSFDEFCMAAGIRGEDRLALALQYGTKDHLDDWDYGEEIL